MGLFDFIKKKPENPASNLPTFQNSGQSPESFSNFQFSEAENVNLSPQKPQNHGFRQNYQAEWQRTPYVSVQQKDPSQEIRTATNQAMQAKAENPVAKKVQDGEDVFKALLDSRYKEDEASLKRQRAAEFWGNVANLFGQTVSSAAGARIFPQIKSNTQQYNAALNKLRDGYNDTLLNYTLANAKADRAAKAEQAKIQLQFERDKALAEFKANLDAGLIDRRTYGALAAQAQKAQSDKELEEVRQEGRMQLARYNQEAATAREIMKQDRMDNRSNKKKKTYPILTFRTRDGRKTKSYDPNDDRELLQYYRDGVELGIFKDLTKESDNFEIDGISYSIGGKGNGFNARNLNPDMLRNYIFYNLDRYNKVTNQNQAMDMFGDGVDWSSYEMKQDNGNSANKWEQYRVK